MTKIHGPKDGDGTSSNEQLEGALEELYNGDDTDEEEPEETDDK